MNTAMVWGANGGIGRALVAALKEDGWQIIAIGRDSKGLSDLTSLVLEADVSDPKAVEQAVYAAAQELDQVGLWIYAVGDIFSAPTANLSPGDWSRIKFAPGPQDRQPARM